MGLETHENLKEKDKSAFVLVLKKKKENEYVYYSGSKAKCKWKEKGILFLALETHENYNSEWAKSCIFNITFKHRKSNAFEGCQNIGTKS